MMTPEPEDLPCIRLPKGQESCGGRTKRLHDEIKWILSNLFDFDWPFSSN